MIGGSGCRDKHAATYLSWAEPAVNIINVAIVNTVTINTTSHPPVYVSIELLTDLAAGAAHAGAVLLRRLHRRVSTGPRVLGEAQVVVRAHVDDVLHHAACVTDSDGHVFPVRTCCCLRSAPANFKVTDMTRSQAAWCNLILHHSIPRYNIHHNITYLVTKWCHWLICIICTLI